MLQAGRSWIRFPIQPLTVMNSRYISWVCLCVCEGGQYVGLTTLPPSCNNCLEIWEPQPPGTLYACTGITLPCFAHFSTMHITSQEHMRIVGRGTVSHSCVVRCTVIQLYCNMLWLTLQEPSSGKSKTPKTNYHVHQTNTLIKLLTLQFCK